MKIAGTRRVLIAGGGPAGLTAAYALCRREAVPVVFERDGLVGGNSRTETYRGYRFDIGGHRFFTKIPGINHIWEDLLHEHFLRVSRLSRIYYNGRFFHYPLKIGNVVWGLGLWDSFLIVMSFLRSCFAPYPREENLEQWISNRFGRRLYRTFFKTYTEKVWGMPCTSIRAEWAAQRIKGLSLRTAVLNAVFRARKSGIKSLIEEFRYPEKGPGMMWETMQEFVEAHGGEVRLHHDVVKTRHEAGRVVSFMVRGPDGNLREEMGTDFISSVPLREVIAGMEPSPPAEVTEAAVGLKYRDFLTVCLIVDRADLFPDNWIYIHSPEVKMGRLQNFGNWSPHMVPEPGKTSLGVEYFVNENDDLWNLPDEALIDFATQELQKIGITRAAGVQGGVVFRQKKAYPVYDETYGLRLAVIEKYLKGFGNLQMIGRNGLHKYNNQDHSMLTALYAVDNLYGACHDIWRLNSDQDYQEEGQREG